MAMKETLGSIRAYFGLAGGLSLLFNGGLLALGLANANVILIPLAGLGVLLGCGFLYLAVALPGLLKTNPIVPKIVVAGNGCYLLLLIGLTFALTNSYQAGQQAVQPMIGLAICAYLWINITRLAREEQDKEKPQ